MNKEILWLAGLGVLGFAAFEYFKSSQQLVAVTQSPVTTPQVSTGGSIINTNGQVQIAPSVTQADINSMTNFIIQNFGFKVDPNGVQTATAGQWNIAFNAVFSTSYNFNALFFAASSQLITFNQWYQVVKQLGAQGLSGLGSIGTLRGWNNANVSRYEVIAAGFPR